MTSGHVFIARSLDGFVAREDHQLDWLMKQQTGDEDHGYDAFMARMDGIVMGRGSYNTVLGFGAWPYTKPVMVMSKTLTQADVPADIADKVQITALEPAELMAWLTQQGWSHAYIDGGRVVQSFIRAGLVDDFILTTIPILIGEGRPLFGALDADVDLELTHVQGFPSGLVESRYTVKRTATDTADVAPSA